MSVGYKQPPRHSQFVKGRSGNPSGRPKGSRKGNSLKDIINQQVAMTVDGVTRRVPLTEATVTKVFQNALNGNASAARLALQLIEKAEQKQIEEEQNPFGIMPLVERIVLSSPNCSECSEQLRWLDVVQLGGENYRVRTWVIEAALARNDCNRLSLRDKDFEEIAKCMLNPEDLPGLREKFGFS